MKFTLELIGNKCNNEYPHLTITHNQKILYSDYVKEKTSLEFEIELHEHNIITLQGIKKSRGENNKFDTIVDSSGTIIEDKHLLINNICFDNIAMSDQWIQHLPFCTEDNETFTCDMGMWNNGYIEFNIGLPLLDWIIQEKFIKFDQTQPSANEYSGGARFDYKYVQEKINLINQLLQ